MSEQNPERLIENAMSDYGAKWNALENLVRARQARRDAADAAFRERIRNAVDEEAAAEDALRHLISRHAELFAARKTRVAGWGTCGLKKQRGQLACANPARAVKTLTEAGHGDCAAIDARSIGKLPPDEIKKLAEFLVGRGHAAALQLNKSAVNKLSVDLTRRAGIELRQDADAVFVSPASDYMAQIKPERAAVRKGEEA